MSLQSKNNSNLREQLDKYIIKWKWFLVSLFICVAFTFLYLRYATNTYKVSATIKIADSNEKGMLMQANQQNDYSLFKKDFNSVQDEIQILSSRAIISKVVNELNLKVRYYIQGSIKELEIYENPPLTINFIENDSLLTNVDTTLTLTVASKSRFSFKGSERMLNFGDKVNMPFGGIILTPNFDQEEMKVGKDVTVKISPLSDITSYYNNQIKIMPSGLNSSIINITLEESVIEKGKDIINGLINTYNQYIIDNKNEVLKVTSDFINNRLKDVTSELAEVNSNSEAIKQSNRLTDLSSQSSIFLQAEREIESQQDATSTELQLIDYMSNYLNENRGNDEIIPDAMSFQNNSTNEMLKKHNDLVIQRNKTLKNSSNKNPVVVNLDAQIISLKQNLQSNLNNLKSSNQIKLNNLNRQNSRISSQIYSAPVKEGKIKAIERQQGIKESIVGYLLQKREESAISHGVSSPNAIIVDEAYASTLPIWPKKSVLFLGSIILGLLVPLITIYITDLLDTKVRTKSDLSRELPIPYIGDVPRASSKQLFIEKMDYSPKAEAFRLVRTNIDFMLSNVSKSKGKTIFVTSTTSKEGKSHTAVNLSKSLSYSNKKILLIETDIRVPKLNKYLGVENKTGIGLTNYIIDDKINFADIINRVSENLDLISCGSIPPNPAELLMDGKVATLFNAVKNKYDYIIVDTAAVGLVTDTLLISKFADMVIYVVRANYIDKRHLVHVAKAMYDEKRLPNMVMLLNGVIQRKGYGYGYGDAPKKKRKLFFNK